MKTFATNGVCAKTVSFETENNTLKNVRFSGGCHGNLQAVAKLVEGMPIDDVIKKLKGIRCGNKLTSCVDQLAQALEIVK